MSVEKSSPGGGETSTYSAAGAARALGISRQGLLKRLKTRPLEKRGWHDGEPAYLWRDLVEWDASIPPQGRPRENS